MCKHTEIHEARHYDAAGPALTIQLEAEAVPAEDNASTESLVRDALQPESQLGFPQITEICDRLEAKPEEIPAAVSLLVGVLHEPESFQLKLKALTIILEMLYNVEVIPWFSLEHGFSAAITELRNARNTSLGETAESSIRMLATEIEKVCIDCDSLSVCSSSSSGWSSGRIWDLASGLKSIDLKRKMKSAELGMTALKHDVQKKVKSAAQVTSSTLKTSAHKSIETTLMVASPHFSMVGTVMGLKVVSKQRGSTHRKQ
jgi:hypothetical protein